MPTLDCREKERGASGAARMSGPAHAQVTRIQQEVGGLEQQLAAAVEAARAAEDRYQQAANRAQVRSCSLCSHSTIWWRC